jgi:membrane fusion protein (multidrug efflux system)
MENSSRVSRPLSSSADSDTVVPLSTRADARPESRETRTDKPATAETPAPAAPRSLWSKWKRQILFAALPLVILGGGYVYATGGQVMSTENAYVQADMVGVSTDVSGTISDIAVHDNQKVAAGDVLFKLDDQQFRLALDRANAQLGMVRNDIAALKASYDNMQGQIAQAQSDLEYSDVGFKRQQQLASKGFASQAAFDQAQHDRQSAVQKIDQLKDQLAGIAANLGGDPSEPVEASAQYKQALAARDEAARQLAHTVVHAPMDGIVTNVPSIQPGQYLAAATTAVSVVATDHVWVASNPKETELTYVKPGQPATVTVDAYPNQEWHGAVDSISPASASSFSLLPAENTSGNWVKVVQRIPIRVRIDAAPGQPPLRVGMSVVLNVDTGHARGLPKL